MKGGRNIGRTTERRNDWFWSWSRSRRNGLNHEGGNDDATWLFIFFFFLVFPPLPHYYYYYLYARYLQLYVCCWRNSPQWARTSSFTRFLDHTQRRTTVGRTPLDEWSARRRDLYLTTHNIHNRQTSMPLVGFEPTISAGERPQTYALDRAATGTGIYNYIHETKHVSKVYSVADVLWLQFLWYCV